MQFSESMISTLKSLEGFRSTAYVDAGGHSIGYGHFIKSGESGLLTAHLSEADGDNFLRSDLAPLQDQLNNTLMADPTQNQFDALGLFGYNCGEGALSKVIATWNNSGTNTDLVTAEMALYVKSTNAAGVKANNSTLEKRRATEISLFNSSLPAFIAGIVADPVSAVTVPVLGLLVIGLAVWFIYT